MRLVVDASIVVKWFTPEAGSDQAQTLKKDDLIAPDLILVEVGNALWKYLRRGALARDQFDATVEALKDTPIALSSVLDLMPAAAQLAADLDHPIYDCFYLALAMREGCPLVSDDKRLLKVAGSRFGGLVRSL